MLKMNQPITEESALSMERQIAEIGQGCTEALAALYLSTHVSVYSFALSLLKNPDDAEDVLHDCYISIYDSAMQYRPAGKPMAWILTITKNLCFRKQRERKRTADIPQEDWENQWHTNPHMTAEDKLLVAECMVQLSDEERQIVVLHAVVGCKHREIAGLLSLPLSTVLSKYNRALKKLRKFLPTEGEKDAS